jgi:hypothetical protein
MHVLLQASDQTLSDRRMFAKIKIVVIILSNLEIYLFKLTVQRKRMPLK